MSEKKIKKKRNMRVLGDRKRKEEKKYRGMGEETSF